MKSMKREIQRHRKTMKQRDKEPTERGRKETQGRRKTQRDKLTEKETEL